TTVRALLDLAGGVSEGRDLGAVQPGGASSNFLGPNGLDARLDFDTLAEAGTMLGSGALVVMADGTDLLAAATNTLRFFRDESCGAALGLLADLPATAPGPVPLDEALGRTPAAGVPAPHALPGFARSTVDGFAVRAADTFGASEGLPSYLDVLGSVPMGRAPE